MSQYYIQYHNAEALNRFPFTKERHLGNVVFDSVVRKDLTFYTTKAMAEKAVGSYCFLITGVGASKKQYYLWTFMKIISVEKEDEYYTVTGEGYNLSKPILLNDLPDFSDFRHFCGNFGIGFQNVTNHSFYKTLLRHSKSGSKQKLPSAKDGSIKLLSALERLSQSMEKVEPKKRVMEIEQTLRNDSSIVKLLKKTAQYKCQFPHCNAVVKMKSGQNYVEVAHIQPFSKGGKSIIGNLLVLCPNHHKEFDFGDLKITGQTPNEVSGMLNGRKFKIKTAY